MTINRTFWSFAILLVLLGTSVQAQDWANLNRFKTEDSLLTTQSAEETRVVFMGNSITEGWGKLSPDFFKDHHYINRGISGQTTPQMLIRFRQDVIQLKPKAVVILAGTNDLAGNTGPSTLEMIEDNLASMAELADANGIKPILSSILPAYDYPWKKETYPAQNIVRLNQWIKNYCEEKGYTYLDYYPTLVDKRGGLPQKYSKDGVHPNLEAFQIMEEIAQKTIAAVLAN